MILCSPILRRLFPVKESAKKAVRRQQQLERLYVCEGQPTAEGTSAGLGKASSSSSPCPSLDTAELLTPGAPASSTAATASASSSCASPSHPPPSSRTLLANRSLQQALVGAVYESKLQRETAAGIRRSPDKSTAIELFLLFAQSSDAEGLTNHTLRTLSSTLVRHQARSLFGSPETYAQALAAARGSADARWAQLSAEEEHPFAWAACRRLQRYAERGSAFCPVRGCVVEGSDNAAVAQIEHQLRKTSARGVPVPTDVIGDLMQLDVSWSTALRLHAWAGTQTPGGVAVPVELTERVMGLMTGYKTAGLGTRPWRHALQLYDAVQQSGYERGLGLHTHALDALWRGAEGLPRSRRGTTAEQDAFWRAVGEVRERVAAGSQAGELRVTGEDGVGYLESLLKASAAAGRWEVAVGLLAEMERTAAETSHRLLVPTAEAYAFAMGACHAQGHVAHAAALRSMFESAYTLRSLHSEGLLVYLRSLRAVVQRCPSVGEQVERLVEDGLGLDRPCAVACLQVLASQHVQTRGRKSALARRLFEYYDSNVWLQQPLARSLELQSVFRCCHLIAASEGRCDLMSYVKDHLTRTFGRSAPELEWLEDTRIYTLHTTNDWREALKIYGSVVERRAEEQVKFLPIPVRQAKSMLIQALLRCCHSLISCGGNVDCRGEDLGSSFSLLEDDAQEEAREEVRTVASRAVLQVERLYGPDRCGVPHEALSQFLVFKALYNPSRAQRNSVGVQAMHQLALGSALHITPSLIEQLAEVLELPQAHVTNLLQDGHPRARYLALTAATRGTKWLGQSSLERVYW